MKNKQTNNFILTKSLCSIIGIYYIGFPMMTFIYSFINMLLTPSIKYINIMLSSLIFYYFGFFELFILGLSITLFYLNNNFNSIKTKISKLFFFYYSLKNTNILDKSTAPENKIILDFINKISKFETSFNIFFKYFKEFKSNKKIIFICVNSLLFFYKFINMVEHLLHYFYHNLSFITNKSFDLSYINNTIKPIYNIINDLIKDKNDIETQDDYINIYKTINSKKINVTNNNVKYNPEYNIDFINNKQNDNTKQDKTNTIDLNIDKTNIIDKLDDINIDKTNIIDNNDFDITYKNIENDLNKFDDLIKELNNMENTSNEITEDEIMKSIDMINLLNKMMKITELPQEDKEHCKNKIKDEIINTQEFMNLLKNSFSQ